MPQKRNSLELPWPTDWAALFGADRPLLVEFGFGNADHLIALAKANPTCNVIGFEISILSMEKAERKIDRLKLPNALAIYSRAETALHHLFTPGSVRQFHINYPDPWFKSRHAGRRLMQRDTLDAIVSRLEPDGLLYLATDIAEYAEMSHELLSETPGLANLLSAPWVHDFPERLITTKYEEKGIREGRPGHYFKYRRNHQPAPDVPVQEELPVPHVVLKTPQPLPEILAQFEKRTHHPGRGIHIIVLNGYHNPKHNSLLFEVLIEEPTIEQRVGLALIPRGASGEYTLKHTMFGMPRPTQGMHDATRFLADWISSLHPEAEILSSSVRR